MPMRQRSRCTPWFRSIASAWLLALAFSAPLAAQQTSTRATIPHWAEGSLVEVPVDELTVRLVPLDLETLELLRADIMSRVRANAIELADAIVARLKLAKAGDESDQDIDAVGERTIELMIVKQQLLARPTWWSMRFEAKGGEVASDRAYLEDDRRASARIWPRPWAGIVRRPAMPTSRTS
jgi:hypothetical protein